MKVLELVFDASEGKTVRISIDEPQEPVDETAVRAAMEAVIEADVFFDSEGEGLSGIKSARVVERNVTSLNVI